MRAQRTVASAVVFATACTVYEPSLLEGWRSEGATTASGGSMSGAGAGASQDTGGSSAAGGSDATAGADGTGGASSAGGSTTGGSTSGGSATAGGANTAGSAGAGGASDPTGPGGGGGNEEEVLIDDMEDANLVFFTGDSGRGRWYLSNDGSEGEQTPGIDQLMDLIPGGRGDSSRAVHTAASGFSGWGASVGFTFENSSSKRAPFDASSYRGVSFFAKVETGSETTVRVAFPDMNTDPLGGVCENEATMSGDCLDHFGATLELTTEFAEYSLEFDALGQKGWGHLEPELDSSALLGMELSWGTAAAEIWVDDVRFFR